MATGSTPSSGGCAAGSSKPRHLCLGTNGRNAQPASTESLIGGTGTAGYPGLSRLPFQAMKSHELDFTELQALAAEVLRVKPERIQMNVSLSRDLGADSLDLLELFAKVEGKYKVRLNEQTLGQMRNVGELWQYLEEQLLQPTE